ncbi:type II toxin-antitoxin system VapC family toxin [Terriglobus sp.]|uniref:type II toxin-antitoxin system VapC family toxin n=1 Tax=Terriglobus sp. TaxID=1889013 RepID=UPI003B00B0FD
MTMMTTAIDTNVLVRAVIDDGSAQAALARKTIREAKAIVATLPALCEAVWVLRTSYQKQRTDIALLLEDLLALPNLCCELAAVQYGIAALKRGADFADAVIAWEGKRLGADEFLSFDRRAVRLLSSPDMRTRLLR